MMNENTTTYYKLSEVTKMLGITRKALQEYDRLDIVHPSSKTEGGYWLYDEEAVNQLRIVVTFSFAGYKRAEIKELLNTSNGNNMDFYATHLGEVVDRLKKQRERLDGMIAMTEMNYLICTKLNELMKPIAQYIQEKQILSQTSLLENMEKAISTEMMKNPENAPNIQMGLEPVLRLFQLAIYREEPNSPVLNQKLAELLDVWESFFIKTAPESAGLKEMLGSLSAEEKKQALKQMIISAAECDNPNGDKTCVTIDKTFGNGCYEEIKAMILTVA